MLAHAQWSAARFPLAPFTAVLGLLVGCSDNPARGVGPGQGAGSASAVVQVDGSSTVYPITEAVAEELSRRGDTRVTVGVSGTGGGFKRLCQREIVVANASRPIRDAELAACASQGVQVVELPIAFDGIAVVVHPANTWAEFLTTEELKALWAPEAQGRILKWSQIRAGWPDEEIHLFGAGVDSGTYDYFTQAIVGREHASRGDFTSSEDDNVLVQGVSTDRLALGFMGLAWQTANAAKLKLVPIDDGNPANGAGPMLPTVTTVRDGTYQPLSRPLFLYVDVAALQRPEVQRFVDAYLREAQRLVPQVGYVALPAEGYALVQRRLERRTTGTVFGGKGSKVGVTIFDLLGAEG